MKGNEMEKHDDLVTDNLGGYKTGGWNAHFILIVCSLLYMINYMDRQVLSIVLQPMKEDLNLTDAYAGALQTIFMLGILVFSSPIAYLIDRWSRRKMLGLMAITWSLATFATGFGNDFWGVAIPRAIVGVGEAGFAAAGIAMITATYSQNSRGRVMGIFNMFIVFGIALGSILAGYISVLYHSWRAPFYVFAIPGIILGVMAFFLHDYKTVQVEKASDGGKGFIACVICLFKIPTLRWLYIGIAMFQVIQAAALGWLPAFMMRAQNINADKAGMILGILFLTSFIGIPLGGYLADFWQKRNDRGRMYVAALSVLCTVIFLAIALILDYKGPGLIFGFLFGFSAGMGIAALASITQDVVPPELKGLSWGMAVFCQYALGAWAPSIVGLMSDGLGGGAYGLRVALISTTVVGGVLSCFCYLIGAKYYTADQDKVKGCALECEK